jgi:hypothetical protein
MAQQPNTIKHSKSERAFAVRNEYPQDLGGLKP